VDIVRAVAERPDFRRFGVTVCQAVLVHEHFRHFVEKDVHIVNLNRFAHPAGQVDRALGKQRSFCDRPVESIEQAGFVGLAAGYQAAVVDLPNQSAEGILTLNTPFSRMPRFV
jgi:hypothetical protein